MALTKANDILGLRKKIEEFAVPIDSLSASKVTVDLPDFSATNAAGAFEELKIDISGLSASVLTIGEKLENISTYSINEKIVGKWIDGSDIYEITTDLGPDGVSVGGGNSVDSNIPIGTIDFCIDAEGITPTKKAVNMGAELGSTYVKMMNPASIQRNIRWFTVRYTKTAPVTTKKTTKKRG